MSDAQRQCHTFTNTLLHRQIPTVNIFTEAVKDLVRDLQVLAKLSFVSEVVIVIQPNISSTRSTQQRDLTSRITSNRSPTPPTGHLVPFLVSGLFPASPIVLQHDLKADGLKKVGGTTFNRKHSKYNNQLNVTFKFL